MEGGREGKERGRREERKEGSKRKSGSLCNVRKLEPIQDLAAWLPVFPMARLSHFTHIVRATFVWPDCARHTSRSSSDVS
jgi:hypothetical protein